MPTGLRTHHPFPSYHHLSTHALSKCSALGTWLFTGLKYNLLLTRGRHLPPPLVLLAAAPPRAAEDKAIGHQRKAKQNACHERHSTHDDRGEHKLLEELVDGARARDENDGAQRGLRRARQAHPQRAAAPQRGPARPRPRSACPQRPWP